MFYNLGAWIMPLIIKLFFFFVFFLFFVFFIQFKVPFNIISAHMRRTNQWVGQKMEVPPAQLRAELG